MSTKEAYIEKLQAQLNEWSAKTEVLKARAKGAAADVKIEYNKKIEELESKKEEADEKLEELKDAGEDAWESLKGGAQSAWDSLGDAVDSAISKFK